MSQRFPATLAALLGFGVAYNVLVERLEAEGHERGYLSHLVAGGCAVTLAAVAPSIGYRAAWRVLLAFAASGSPMIVGSMWRHMQERRREEIARRRDHRKAAKLHRIELAEALVQRMTTPPPGWEA